MALIDLNSPDSHEINTEIREVQLSLELAHGASLWGIFTMGPQRIFHRAMLAASVLMFLQLTGVNAITFYTTKIFEDSLMLGSVKSRILSALYQLVSPIGGIICIFTIDSFGRRGLMLTSAAGNAICLALVAGLSSQAGNDNSLNAAVAFIFIFHFTYVLGFGGIPFLYATEIAPLHLRAAISGAGVATFWAFNFLMAEVTPTGFDSISWKYFLIFSALNVIMIPIIYYLFPETARRSLEEIDEIFTNSTDIFAPVKLASSLPRRNFDTESRQKHLEDLAEGTRQKSLEKCQPSFAQLENAGEF
ncbi:hypothetical protein Plec18167_005973 [Paecilomyces lecythidis]|uniref:Major facilitator superfamily (MFS) profile domain-containing protein n=1 Tax=Paecilomyces lecythidis TaxID=3004212 RepID=A0ABR3XE28_9EURO